MSLSELEKLIPPSQDDRDTMLMMTSVQFGKKRMRAVLALAEAAPALIRVARAAEKGPCRHFAEQKGCELCEALAELG